MRTLTDLLQRYPKAGAVTDDPTIRRIATTAYPYLILYEATGDEIIIHAVRHGARDPPMIQNGVSPRRMRYAEATGSRFHVRLSAA
jgi:toxin ParE1/3/4